MSYVNGIFEPLELGSQITCFPRPSGKHELNDLPLELVFTTISYLDNATDINKFIYCSDQLIDTFKHDATWTELYELGGTLGIR
jgi:hypothetical protein